MPEQEPSQPPLDPEEAMNTALQAERQAVAGIEFCTRQAAKLVENAQQQARHLAERTNRRISDLHARCTQATAERIDSMLKEDANEADEGVQPHVETEFLQAVVDSVAARLTGENESPD
jgi:vacuolar-type H+-ATPase subunit H